MPRKGRRRGFTLIEVVVAFAILALALGVFLRVFSGGLGNARISEDYTMATLLAQSKLAAVGIEEPLTEGEAEGRIDGRFRWRIVVRPWAEDPPAEEAPLRAYDVAVAVFWGKADEERSVSLSTLRLAPRK